MNRFVELSRVDGNLMYCFNITTDYFLDHFIRQVFITGILMISLIHYLSSNFGAILSLVVASNSSAWYIDPIGNILLHFMST